MIVNTNHFFCVAQKGNAAALCTLGKKRRRTRAQIEADGLASQMNERMEEEVARRTKTLRDSLAASE